MHLNLETKGSANDGPQPILGYLPTVQSTEAVVLSEATVDVSPEDAMR